MPDDFDQPRPRTVPCVPRRPAVPVADGPREADEQPVVVTRFLDGSASPVKACEPTDEMDQARKARDLLNRLAQEDKVSLEVWDTEGGGLLVVRRLVPRTVYDEEVLP